MKILVYRWEHSETKDGPFKHSGQIIEVANSTISHKDPETFPIFIEFFKTKNIDEYIFGWISEELCVKFIKKGRIDLMHKHGFKVYSFHTNEYLILPDGQVVFKR